MPHFKIIWTPEAKSSYFGIIKYLIDNWSHREVVAFSDKINNILEFISRNPQMGKWNSDLECNVLVVSPQVSLFYDIDLAANIIFILTFWDNRRKPLFQ